MSIRHFRIFIAVAEEENITKAAKKLGYSQSTVSFQIRQLEEEIGVPLFHKGEAGRKREAVMTYMGEKIYQHALVILNEQQRIAEFIQNSGALPEIKKILSKVYDLERICGKIAFGSVSPKDMLSLGQSIEALGQLGECFATMDAPQWKELFTQGDLLEDIHTLIDAAINPDAPLVIKDGNVIKTGYHPEIDSYREAGDKGKDWIRDLEIKEREATGIKSLKVKYNRIFGYKIQVICV